MNLIQYLLSKRWSVTVYLVDRAYGGPEEGGWWYTTGDPVKDDPRNRTFLFRWQAQRYLPVLRAELDDENQQERRNMYSVLSEGEYHAQIHQGRAESFPQERPHYE